MAASSSCGPWRSSTWRLDDLGRAGRTGVGHGEALDRGRAAAALLGRERLRADQDEVGTVAR